MSPPEDRLPRAGAASPLIPLTEAEGDAFWQKCMALRPKLAGYLRGMLPDHHAVEDCLQDTFVIMAQRYHEADGDDFSALAFTCGRNKARNWLAKHHTGTLAILSPEMLGRIAEAAACGEEGETIGYGERIGVLRACMDLLSPEQRSLINARYGKEAKSSIQILAQRKKRKADALYKQLERLRLLLKRCISDKLPDLDL